jgi:hypothetical protein
MVNMIGKITKSARQQIMYIHPMAGRHLFCIQSSLLVPAVAIIGLLAVVVNVDSLLLGVLPTT